MSRRESRAASSTTARGWTRHSIAQRLVHDVDERLVTHEPPRVLDDDRLSRGIGVATEAGDVRSDYRVRGAPQWVVARQWLELGHIDRGPGDRPRFERRGQV